MTADDDSKSASIFDAEAYAALHRLAGHMGAATNAISEARHALEMAGQSERARELAKAEELHRLASARLASIARRLGESR